MRRARLGGTPSASSSASSRGDEDLPVLLTARIRRRARTGSDFVLVRAERVDLASSHERLRVVAELRDEPRHSGGGLTVRAPEWPTRRNPQAPVSKRRELLLRVRWPDPRAPSERRMASESVSARERVTSLYAAREAMETEMASIAGRLSQPGAPGLKGSLVDEEGFPIPGVDLYAVRADRGRYAVLRNDHEAITAELALALARVTKQAGAGHAVTRLPDGRREDARPRASAPPSRALSPEGEKNSPQPFAVVDDVAAGSPAHTAGFAVGDQVLQFGDVARRGDEGGGAETLARVAAAAASAAAAGAAAAVSVRRRGALAQLECFPRAWEGRGLLGCHMRPV